MHDRVVAQRTSRRARRIADAALLFTALGGVSLVVAVEELIFDEPPVAADWYILLGVFLVVMPIALYLVRSASRKD